MKKVIYSLRLFIVDGVTAQLSKPVKSVRGLLQGSFETGRMLILNDGYQPYVDRS